MRVAVADNRLVLADGFHQAVEPGQERFFRRLDAGVAPLVLLLRGSDTVGDTAELGQDNRRSVVAVAVGERLTPVARDLCAVGFEDFVLGGEICASSRVVVYAEDVCRVRVLPAVVVLREAGRVERVRQVVERLRVRLLTFVGQSVDSGTRS